MAAMKKPVSEFGFKKGTSEMDNVGDKKMKAMKKFAPATKAAVKKAAVKKAAVKKAVAKKKK